MKPNKLFLLLGLVIVYYFIVLFVYNYNTGDNIFNSSNTLENDGNTKLNVQDQVSISVQRNRFYGTITESNGESYVSLLNIVKLPLKKGGINFVTFHIIFAIILSILIFIFNKKEIERRPDES